MLGQFETLVDALRFHARERPYDTAVTFLLDGEQESVFWTYRDLDRRANEIAATLRSRDLSGERVLLLHPPGLEFIAALYGCFYAGVIAVPTYPPRLRIDSRASTRLIELMEDVKPAVVLTTEANAAKSSWWSARVMGSCQVEWLATDGSDFRVHHEAVTVEVPPDSIAMLQYTSGSTRSPKGVILTHGNLMDNERIIATQMRQSAASHALIWLPPYHDMGLIGGIFQPLTVGFPLTLMDPLHVMQRPLRWLQAITRTRATTSGAPNSIFELCLRTVRDEERDGLALDSWTIAFIGSEPIRAGTVECFAEFFAPCGFRSDAFFPCYGLAEATLLVSGRAGLSHSGGTRCVSCGPPGPGFELAIVDADSLQECEEGRTGEIWLSGSSVARGYWNRPDETHQTFENSLPGRSGQFLRTGDLGFLKGGELFVTGRIKDLVIVRGRNLYPQDIEVCAGVSHPALSPEGCVAFAVDASEGEGLIVACELRREERNRSDSDEIIQAVRQSLAEEFEVGVAAILLLKPASILRTTSGKVRRSACKQAFLEGSWQPVGKSADKSQVKEESSLSLGSQVRRVLSAVLSIPEHWLDDQKSLASLGVDSLMRLELLLRLESELDVRLDSSLMTGETTTADLINAVDSALARQYRRSVPKYVLPAIGQRVPLTPIQSEFLNECEEPEKYAIVLMCRTPPNTDSQALEKALGSYGQRHDAFRLRFRRSEGQWTQEYDISETAIDFRRLDMRDVTRDKVQLTAKKVFAEISGNLNISEGPLAQAVFLDRGAEENGMLLLSMHHLIADGASIPLLLYDLESAYLNRGGLHSDISYAEWAYRLDALAQSEQVHRDLPYWQKVCHAELSDFGVPRGPATASPLVRLDPVQSRRFLERFTTAQEQHDFFLAALAQAWNETTGQHDLLVRLENHGRFPLDGVAPIRTVGWCTQHFPARIDSGGLQGDAALNRVRSRVASTPNNGVSFGLLKYLCRDPDTNRAMRELAMPQASLVYRGRMATSFRRDMIFPVIAHYVLDAAGRKVTSQPALMLTAGVEGQIVWWRINYRPENFAPDLVGRIAAEIQRCAANI